MPRDSTEECSPEHRDEKTCSSASASPFGRVMHGLGPALAGLVQDARPSSHEAISSSFMSDLLVSVTRALRAAGNGTRRRWRRALSMLRMCLEALPLSKVQARRCRDPAHCVGRASSRNCCCAPTGVRARRCRTRGNLPANTRAKPCAGALAKRAARSRASMRPRRHSHPPAMAPRDAADGLPDPCACWLADLPPRGGRTHRNFQAMVQFCAGAAHDVPKLIGDAARGRRGADRTEDGRPRCLRATLAVGSAALF